MSRFLPAARPMILRRALRTSAACSLALALTCTPVLAQGLSSNELWGRWQSKVEETGGKLQAGNEAREGNQLRLTDLRLQLSTAEKAPVVLLDELVLVNRADGSVGIALPESFTLRVQFTQGNSDVTRESRFLVAAPGLELAIMGVGERSNFMAKAPSISVNFDGITPPLSLNEPQVNMILALADLNLRYQHDLSTPAMSADGELSLGTLHGEVSSQSENEPKVDMRFDLAGVTARISGAIPPEAVSQTQALANAADPQKMILPILLAGLKAGTFFDVSVALAKTEFHIAGESDGQPFELDLQLNGVDSNIRLDKEQLRSKMELTGLSAAIPGGLLNLPTSEGPLGFSLDNLRYGYAIGLNGLKDPQPWSYLLRLDNLAITPSGWTLMDNFVTLPHEPISVLFDLAGTYGVKPEMLDGSYDPQTTDALPLNDLSFKINAADLTGLGLGIKSSGNLRFNLDDLTSFDGMPAPKGTINVLTTGANGVLNALVEAGIVPQDQLFGIRAGLAMIGKATGAPDTLETKLEFNPPNIVLNGLKIR